MVIAGEVVTRFRRSVLSGAGKRVGSFVRRKPLGAFGGLLVGVGIIVAILGPFWAPYDPFAIARTSVFTPPGKDFLLGTDNYGRDVLSRLLYGARVSIFVGLASVALGTTGGALLGLVSGYLAGSLFDTFVQRIVDSMMALPTLILALILSISLGSSALSVVVAIALAFMPEVQRVVRASALSIKDAQYVEATRAIGASSSRIILRHVLPQCIPPYLVIGTAMLGQAIIVESSISFVGAGPPPPTPTWGNMLSEAARFYATKAPWLVIIPGLAISLTVYGFNLLGDALRDVLDPRLRGR